MSSDTEIQRVIIEIGPFGTPIYGTSIYAGSQVVKDKIDRGALYIGIDKDISYLLPSLYHPVAGDLANLPIKDSLADEIWLMNVFGAIDPSFEANNYFSEISRIMKLNGRINIGELFTPARWVTQIDYRNFGLEKKIFRGSSALRFIEDYKMSSRFADYFTSQKSTGFARPFFMTLTKR